MNGTLRKYIAGTNPLPTSVVSATALVMIMPMASLTHAADCFAVKVDFCVRHPIGDVVAPAGERLTVCVRQDEQKTLLAFKIAGVDDFGEFQAADTLEIPLDDPGTKPEIGFGRGLAGTWRVLGIRYPTESGSLRYVVFPDAPVDDTLTWLQKSDASWQPPSALRGVKR